MSKIFAIALALGVLAALGLEGCVKETKKANASYFPDDKK